MVGLGETMTANIKQANDLAVANGMAGASAQDIGKIIGSSVMQGVNALRALEQEAAGLVQTIFGGDLQSQIDGLKKEQLLADILAANQGHPLPFSAEQLAEDATGTITPATATGAGKSGAVGYKPPGTGGAQPASIATVTTSPDVTGAVSKNTDAMSRRLDRVIDVLVNTREDIKALVMHNRNVRP
jgi:hypothetical protein